MLMGLSGARLALGSGLWALGFGLWALGSWFARFSAGYRYFPIIGANSFLTSAGTASGLVMIACSSALAHSHCRSNGNAATAPAITCCAVFAFCVRLAMIM